MRLFEQKRQLEEQNKFTVPKVDIHAMVVIED